MIQNAIDKIRRNLSKLWANYDERKIESVLKTLYLLLEYKENIVEYNHLDSCKWRLLAQLGTSMDGKVCICPIIVRNCEMVNKMFIRKRKTQII